MLTLLADCGVRLVFRREQKRVAALAPDYHLVGGREAANTLGLEYSVVSVQIDGGQSAAEIEKQLAKLEEAAKQQGTAIGVVRLKPAAAKQLAAWASKLEGKGLVLVPVSAAVRSQRQS